MPKGKTISSMMKQSGKKKKMMPKTSTQSFAARRKAAVEEVHPHMFVELQHIGRAQKEDGREHLPLDFQPGVRARG